MVITPELNMSPVLGQDEASYHQSLIGIMRWMIEIEPIDINIELSLLLSHSTMSRHGPLVAMLHIMCYLKLRYNSKFEYDQPYPDVDQSNFWD